MSMARKVPYQRTPDAEHRFYLYDPEGEGMCYYADQEQRDRDAAAAIEAYCQDGWGENVDEVTVGECTGKSTRHNVTACPQRVDFDTDEDYDDALAEHPGGDEYDYTCNWSIMPLDVQNEPVPR